MASGADRINQILSKAGTLTTSGNTGAARIDAILSNVGKATVDETAYKTLTQPKPAKLLTDTEKTKLQFAEHGYPMPTQNDINNLYTKRDNLVMERDPQTGEFLLNKYVEQSKSINNQIDELLKIVPNAQTRPTTLERLGLSASSGVESGVGGLVGSLQTGLQWAGDKLGKLFGTEEALANPENQALLQRMAEDGAFGPGSQVKGDPILDADKLIASASEKQAKATQGTQGLGKFALDAVNTGTNMLTGQAIAGALGLPFTGVMGAQAGGNAAINAKNQGKTIDQQMLYGASIGVATGLIESLGGIGASQAIKTAAGTAVSKLLSKLPSALVQWMGTSGAKITGKILSAAGSEALEEGLDYNVDIVLQKLILNNDVPYDVKDMAYQMLLGGTMGGVFGGGTVIAPNVIDSINQKAQQPVTNNTQNIQPAPQKVTTQQTQQKVTPQVEEVIQHEKTPEEIIRGQVWWKISDDPKLTAAYAEVDRLDALRRNGPIFGRNQAERAYNTAKVKLDNLVEELTDQYLLEHPDEFTTATPQNTALNTDSNTTATPKVESAVQNLPTVESKAETAQPTYTYNYQPDVQSINNKTWYHGTGTQGLTAAKLTPTATKIEGLLGSGIYLTDNPQIADGYAKGRGKKTGTPTVYESQVSVDNVIDMSKSMTPDVYKPFDDALSYYESEYGYDNEIAEIRKMQSEGAPGVNVYRKFSELMDTISHQEMIPLSEFYDTFDEINDALSGMGYDAYTHEGGKIIGKNPHQVLVLLDPNGLYSPAPKRNITSFTPKVTTTQPTMPEGMGAASTGFAGTVERGFSKNVATDNNMQADIREDFQLAPEMYNRLGNKETLAKAQAEFDKGVDVALTGLNQRIGNGKISPSDVPLSRLIANSLAKSGNLDGARAVISDVAVLLTEAGQLGQAANILRNADPISVENTIQKAIDKINEELRRRGSKYTIVLTQEEIDMIQSADFSQEGTYEWVYEKIAKRIGAEMPSTLWEKLTEIRRIAMLLNPKTQLRNVVGNVPLMGMRKASERLAGGVQDVLVKINEINSSHQAQTEFGKAIQKILAKTFTFDKSQQTRTFTVSKDSKNLADQLFELNKESLVNGSDKWDMNTLIRQYRKYFGKSMAGKATDAVRTFTYNLLQKGDYPFLRSAFVDNAAQYIEAQGYTTIDEIPIGVVEKATQQALEATFRDASTLARLLNQMKRQKAGFALDILFPFTTTPINIAKRTFEYSPLGAIKVVTDIATKQDGATIIDDITKTLTGSAVVALGFLLKSLGAITGAADKDKDKANFDKATGNNPYSIAGKVSYDWLQPAGSLLAMGAAAYDAASTQEGVVDKIVNTITASGDAYLNMTFFQNIIDLLKGYGSPTENVLTTILTSGVSQFTPSLFGALARTVDPTVRTSYTGSDVLQSMVAGAQQKTPFASQGLPASVNVKGEDNKRIDNFLLRGFQEILNPATVNTNKANQVDELIKSLYKTTNDKGVFPRVAPTDIEGVKLTGDEKAQFQKTLGETTYNILMSEMNSKSFTALSDEQKAAVVKEIISFANDSAKREYAESKGQNYTSDYDEESQIKDVGKYFIYNTQYGNTSADNKQARIALLSDTTIKPDQQKLIYNALFSDDYYSKYEQYGKASSISAKTFITLMQNNTKKADMIAAAERSNLSEKQINALLEAKNWKPDYSK